MDLIFADPPYNLQLKNTLYRPDKSKVEGVFDNWDHFDSFKAYDLFTEKWLTECHRVLKEDGCIWIIGTYHNIFRVGALMQNLGYWLLNDIVWIKNNPMPNFKGTRFNNAHETLIWAAKNEKSHYTFHYKAMKTYNDDLQMRSDWYLPICTGEERLKVNGVKVHSTQKPEELLYRVILSASNHGDVILDPFSGSGTTAAIAKKLGRRYIAIEKEAFYVETSIERLTMVEAIKPELLEYIIERKTPRVSFGQIIEKKLIKVGEYLYSRDKKHKARIMADSSLLWVTEAGSIHQITARIQKKVSGNGWTFWHVERKKALVGLNHFRELYWKEFGG